MTIHFLAAVETSVGLYFLLRNVVHVLKNGLKEPRPNVPILGEDAGGILE